MPEVKASDLLGMWEVAQELGLTKQAVALRRKAGVFPLPFAELRMGPIWLRSQLEPLKRKKRKKLGGDLETRNPDT